MPDKAFAMKDFWPLYWKIKRQPGWRQRSFDADKAYLCCMLAELAYLHLKQHEIDQWKRIKLFPCATLAAAVVAGPSEVTAAIFAGIAGERIEVVIHIVETQSFISIAVVIDEVVFIASRGTSDAYDRRIDLDCALDPPLMRQDNLRMHRGFLGEALKHADLIANRLALPEDKRPPAIYTCGHSLGGALAAILRALYGNRGPWLERHWHHPYYREDWTPLVHLSNWFQVDCCYAVAPPRYGDPVAVKQLANPYSIVRAKDPIIYVPLRRQGYADGLREYGTDFSAAARRDDGLLSHAARSLANIVKRRGWMAEHDCTLYREEMARALKLEFHRTLVPTEMLSRRII